MQRSGCRTTPCPPALASCGSDVMRMHPARRRIAAMEPGTEARTWKNVSAPCAGSARAEPTLRNTLVSSAPTRCAKLRYEKRFFLRASFLSPPATPPARASVVRFRFVEPPPASPRHRLHACSATARAHGRSETCRGARPSQAPPPCKEAAAEATGRRCDRILTGYKLASFVLALALAPCEHGRRIVL